MVASLFLAVISVPRPDLGGIELGTGVGLLEGNLAWVPFGIIFLPFNSRLKFVHDI